MNMLRAIVIVCAISTLANAQPAAKKTPTGGVSPAMSKRQASATGPTATPPAPLREETVERMRDEEIVRIEALLPKVRDANQRADLQFQLARLWDEKARYAEWTEGTPLDTRAQQRLPANPFL